MDRCTLLVVDDDELQLSALVRSTRGLRDLEVVTATSSAMAIELARTTVIHAAVVDLLLGSESGIDLIATLRRVHPLLPIAAMTASASEWISDRARAVGAIVVLPKPVNLGTIARVFPLPQQELQALHLAEYPTVERVIWEHVRRAYEDHGGNVLRTARALGLDRNTVKKQLAKPRPPA